MWQEEREERHREEKRRRQAKQELWREEQPLLLQPSYRLSGPSQEDEWIAPDSPKPEAPQPSTSQQAFHFSAPATVADTTTSDGISTQGGWGFPGGPPATYLAATHAGASWGNAASAVGGRAPLGSSIAFRYSGGLPRPGAWMTTGEPTMGALSGSLAHAIANGARAQEAAERAAAAAAAGLRSSIPASLSSPATIRLLRKPCIVSTSVMNHPFVRLPTRIVDETETPVAIDLEKATMHARKIRCAVPLLREAHELLSHGSLTTAQSKQLALVAGELIERAMHYEHQDQSLKKTSRAVVRLGIRFLLLDTVVSALMVLGQEPDAGYWKIITDAIDHNAPLFAERAGFIQRTTYYLRLCHDLSNALQILKKGKRPAPEELLRIKQMLLCSPLSPAPFKGEDFEPWRVDNSRANSRP
ncbi:hypothetical protein EBH_0010590 [Eimeria brunetti]|uniref:Uncharacterized protein n=1 Tax=Eimeria brunetti TaxID=51314 RepID=U6L9Z4_9EIME|nr:hypothetical protein EBH_0010590 [Eimeria brunetti]